MMHAILTTTILMFGACEDECRNLPNAIECDSEGRCWSQHPDWKVPAQSFDFAGMEAGVDGGILEQAPPPVESESVECWRYGSDGDYGHVCSISTTCYDLHARPIDELMIVADSCDGDPAGAWDSTVETAFGCYGVFDDLGLAVPLQY